MRSLFIEFYGASDWTRVLRLYDKGFCIEDLSPVQARQPPPACLLPSSLVSFFLPSLYSRSVRPDRNLILILFFPERQLLLLLICLRRSPPVGGHRYPALDVARGFFGTANFHASGLNPHTDAAPWIPRLPPDPGLLRRRRPAATYSFGTPMVSSLGTACTCVHEVDHVPVDEPKCPEACL